MTILCIDLLATFLLFYMFGANFLNIFNNLTAYELHKMEKLSYIK